MATHCQWNSQKLGTKLSTQLMCFPCYKDFHLLPNFYESLNIRSGEWNAQKLGTFMLSTYSLYISLHRYFLCEIQNNWVLFKMHLEQVKYLETGYQFSTISIYMNIYQSFVPNFIEFLLFKLSKWNSQKLGTNSKSAQLVCFPLFNHCQWNSQKLGTKLSTQFPINVLSTLQGFSLTTQFLWLP